MKKIAVIGSGISGLSSAYFLRNQAEVHLYESENRLGGHANTAEVTVEGNKVLVDTGFMVFNPERYPNFVKLLKSLSVETVETDMSLSVELENRFLFRSNFPNGTFIQRKNIFSLRHYLFLYEIVRFRSAAKKFIRNPLDSAWDLSLSDFLDKNSFSQELRERYLFPQITAIWSCSTEEVGKFPALSTLVFFNNHKLLNNKTATWYTIKNGSQSYVKKIESELKNSGVKILLSSPITLINRTESGVSVTTDTSSEVYDFVISAVHADMLSDLITDKNANEVDALASFSYTDNKVILHSDISVLPKKRRAWASWNYFKSAESKEVFTYYMNSLQSLNTTTPVLVSLNPAITIDTNAVHGKYTYSHPQYSLSSVVGQKKIKELQGTNGILYTGAHLGYGFHEDGITSAIDALKSVGIEPEW